MVIDTFLNYFFNQFFYIFLKVFYLFLKTFNFFLNLNFFLQLFLIF